MRATWIHAHFPRSIVHMNWQTDSRNPFLPLWWLCRFYSSQHTQSRGRKPLVFIGCHQSFVSFFVSLCPHLRFRLTRSICLYPVWPNLPKLQRPTSEKRRNRSSTKSCNPIFTIVESARQELTEQVCKCLSILLQFFSFFLASQSLAATYSGHSLAIHFRPFPFSLFRFT